jgi:CBS domain-containing protein
MGITNQSLMSLCAADIMSRNILMIRREMSLQGAARLLSRAGVTGAPVVDDLGRCVGVLSATDVMHSVETHESHPAASDASASSAHSAWQIPDDCRTSCLCVGDFMTKDPVLVGPTMSIDELARIMVDAHIHRVIVVERGHQQPLGIVSSMDILAAVARLDQSPRDDENPRNYESAVGAYITARPSEMPEHSWEPD